MIDNYLIIQKGCLKLGEKQSSSEIMDELIKSKEIINDLEVHLKSAEEERKNERVNMEFLSETALELVELSFEVDVYDYTAKKIKELFEDSIIVVASYDEHSDFLTSLYFEGLNERVSGAIKKLTGQNPYDFNFSFREYDEKTKNFLLSREVHLLEDGSYMFLKNKIPRSVCKMIEKIAGVKEIYDIGLSWDGKFYGAVVIALKSESLLMNRETMETFVNMVSVAIQRKQAEDKIKKALKEKELLLKEIHHRTKNNLMVMSSILELQSQHINDEETLDIFRESQDRANSMALIHERLYQSTDLKRIDFGEYIQNLTTDLFHTYLSDLGRIKLNINADNEMVDIDTTVPLGLILNELVTNSMKYAFPDGAEGEIDIEFHKDDDEFVLMVCDTGMGFPEDLDFRNTDSLGLQLVNNLTRQINGTIELERKEGTKFEIKFKELYK